MSYIFNPFGKDFNEVKEADLNILKTVSEGWYVEYKERCLEGQKIAKAISSFANSHGGIYFVGIEADKRTNYAKNFIGVDDSPDVIRDSVGGNLQPFPFFETFSISLSTGKNVLMVVVHSGENPPYINSDGRIYRRQEAASDPIPENNRFTIDELYRKAEKYTEALELFRSFDLTFNNAESDIPYLEIFINTKPFNHFFIDRFFEMENLENIKKQFNGEFIAKECLMGKEVSFSGSIKFDSLNTYHNSVSLRFLEGIDLAYNGITLMLDVQGNLKLLVPLNDNQCSFEKLPKEYQESMNKSKIDSLSFIGFLNARIIFGAIFAVIMKYIEYLKNEKYKDGFEVKIRLRNCYRKILYIESTTLIEHIKKFNIPICMKNEQYFSVNPIIYKIEELETKPITRCSMIFAHIANALGVPYNVALAAIIEEITNNPQPSKTES